MAHILISSLFFFRNNISKQSNAKHYLHRIIFPNPF
nr:MAG TPA: hypothetical protein [Bacteriophage sp.]